MPSVFDILEDEWARTADGPPPTAQLAAVCAEVGAASLAGLRAWVRSAPAGEADRVLVPLARAAANDSAVAARVLLQLLLPGARRLAATWWALGDAEERAAVVVAAVYGRIRRYPIERRPRAVAANILLDAGQDLRRAARQVTRDAAHVVCVDPRTLPSPQRREDAHPAQELAQLLGEAVVAGQLRPDDAELVAATRIGGRRLADMAAERGAKLRTLQWRRQRAEAALAGSGAVG